MRRCTYDSYGDRLSQADRQTVERVSQEMAGIILKQIKWPSQPKETQQAQQQCANK